MRKNGSFYIKEINRPCYWLYCTTKNLAIIIIIYFSFMSHIVYILYTLLLPADTLSRPDKNVCLFFVSYNDRFHILGEL